MSRKPTQSGDADAGEVESGSEKWLIILLAIAIAIGVTAILIHLIPQITDSNPLIEVSGEMYYERAIFYRVSAIVVFTLFIPFTCVSFYYSRRRERRRELREDFNMLQLNYRYYVEIFSRDNKPLNFFFAGGFASIVTVLGLIAVLLGDELGLDVGPNLLLGGAFVESDKEPEGEAVGSELITRLGKPPVGPQSEISTTVSKPPEAESDEQTETAQSDPSQTGDEAAEESTTQSGGIDEGGGAADQPAMQSGGMEQIGDAAEQSEAGSSSDATDQRGKADSQWSTVQRNSLMFFGIAFLGAYLWGLQQIIIRYFRNDLVPGVYYNLGVRMIFAAIIALLIYQMIHAFGLDPVGQEAGVGTGILPAIAFLIGIFPQRALRYMSERVNVFSSVDQPNTGSIPLEMIQGITVDDKLRLVEEGVDTVSDLANADIIRLLFTTPYTTSQLIDWLLQAKLCVLVGDDIKELRAHAVRTARDLKNFPENGERSLEVLAEETKITKNTILAAHRSISEDAAVTMLIELYDRVNSVNNLRRSTKEQMEKAPEGLADSQQAAAPEGAAASGDQADEQKARERGNGRGDAKSGASRAATTRNGKPAKPARVQRPKDRATKRPETAKTKAARPESGREPGRNGMPASAVARANRANKKNGRTTAPRR